MNIMKKLEIRKKIVKNKGMNMQKYLHLICLLSYTNNLGTNLC